MLHGKGRGRSIQRSLRAALFALCAVFLAAMPVSVPAEDGFSSSTYLELQLSSEPAAKIAFRQSFTFPFLQGDGPLTSGNNITTVLSAEVSPISVNGIGELIWSPAAFLLLSGGGLAGSGWNIPLAYGIGINRPDPDDEDAPRPRRSRIDGSAFDGLIWNAWGAATLQFDLGAVIPGDWNHILFQTRHEFRYGAYTRARAGETWVFENHFRENQNGWIYNASYVIGYYMPRSPVLNTIAFMAEMRRPLYNTPGGSFWGENLGYWVFSGILNFAITPRLNTTMAVQMHTRRNHGSRNFNNNDYFYRDLALERDGGQRRLLFRRVGVIINYRLR